MLFFFCLEFSVIVFIDLSFNANPFLQMLEYDEQYRHNKYSQQHTGKHTPYCPTAYGTIAKSRCAMYIQQWQQTRYESEGGHKDGAKTQGSCLQGRLYQPHPSPSALHRIFHYQDGIL